MDGGLNKLAAPNVYEAVPTHGTTYIAKDLVGSLENVLESEAQIQSDQKVSVHLMITIQLTPLSQHTSFLPHYLAQSAWQPTARARGH
jgi:hypothetical protein